MRQVFLIGDSLMQHYNLTSYPQFGYGTMFNLFTKEDVCIINLAHAGCSTKSFIEQNRFKPVIENIKKDDLLIIEFGNNDEKESDPLRYTDKDTTFIDNLKYFYNEAISKGANAYIFTSPTRFNIKDDLIIDDHKGYPQSIIKYLSSNYNVIDLYSITTKFYNLYGLDKCHKFHLIYDKDVYYRYKDGTNDTSHYNKLGALLISSLMIYSLEKNFDKFNEYFITLEDALLYKPNLLDEDIINLIYKII